MVTVSKVVTVVCVLLGGAAGYLVGPWLAVLRRGAPWWAPFAFYLSVGPLRWFPWLVAGSWVESDWLANAIGDGGSSVGVLQYNDGAAVKPKDRGSAFWSGFAAAEYTVTVAARGGVASFVALRWPIVGYLAWRWSWRSGTAPALVGPISPPRIPAELLAGDLGERERKGALFGLALWVGLAVAVFMGRKAMARR